MGESEDWDGKTSPTRKKRQVGARWKDEKELFLLIDCVGELASGHAIPFKFKKKGTWHGKMTSLFQSRAEEEGYPARNESEISSKWEAMLRLFKVRVGNVKALDCVKMGMV